VSVAAPLLAAYFVVLAGLAALGLHRLWMAAVALRAPPPPEAPTPDAFPPLVVQLPLYNEATVAERLLRAVAALRYPGALTLQVLDDSTDETRRVVDRVTGELRAAGVDVQVVRRPQRTGYKAGALAHGLAASHHPLVAIFDADFVPGPDFLLRTVPALLADPQVGLVQARWGHLNRGRSLLTRAQAVFLDGHFAVEHQARAAAGHLFNFNGTAGVWRRAAIEAGGGWRAATITEDLDLSYRAQLAGWRFVYCDAVVTPAELPESWAAFRAQQARWVRGSVETARLLVGPVLRSSLPLGQRAGALLHLLQNLAYVWMAALATLLPAAVILRDQLGWRVPGGQGVLAALDLGLLGAGTCAMILFYGVAARRTGAGLAGWLDVPFALCVGAGMSLTNAAEVLAGLRSRGSEFLRTPKRGDGRGATRYHAAVQGGRVALELLYLLYFGAAVVYALQARLLGALPFLILYGVGFGAVALGSLREPWAARPLPIPAAERSEA
jgi:hypothetical protein